MISNFHSDSENAEDERRRLIDDLSAPMRHISEDGQPSIKERDPNAPIWWHGDEDASQASMAAMAALRKRR